MDKDTDILKGLSSAEAARRLAASGPNELERRKGRSAAGLFLSQFCDVLVLMLAAATLFSFVIGQRTEAVTIIAVMLLNTTMGFVQEYRTEKTLENLKKLTSPVARVLRDGKRATLAASGLVAGDVIALRAGDRVPADCELRESAGLSCDEALLTGESAAVEKNPRDDNKLFMGASVLSGHGTAVVTATGMATAMGKIASLLSSEKEPPTPLQKRLAALGRFIAVVCVLCAVAVIALGALRGENFYGLVLTGISLAVAAIPEGLPAVVTIVLALSVGRLLDKKALIRKLHAVETLGSATVICSDKTGTMTENVMTVTRMWSAGESCSLSGGPNDARGELKRGSEAADINTAPPLKAALVCAALCSTASVELSGGALERSGSPTETALLVAAHKCGLRRDALLSQYRVLSERPFDSAKKYMSVHVERAGERAVFIKGAPSAVLARCSHAATTSGDMPMGERERAAITAAAAEMASGAMRVIALAGAASDDFCDDGFTLLGLAGIVDPLRTEVASAVRKCRRAGVRVIMITGDHPLTASAVAARAGLIEEGGEVCEGPAIEKMGDDALRERVKRCNVFARVSPAHKLRIVKALRSLGEVVAMTGDGVNDAPAVRAADIGVAMGLAGSDVTKEAASLVVLDDNFATIVSAVEEGRVIYDNIRRFIRFLLASNLGEVLTVLLAMALGAPAVFIPIQILLINLITDSLPAVALGMENGSLDVMRRAPRAPSEGLLAGGLALEVVFRGAVMGLGNLLAFTTALRVSGDITVARSAALLTLVAAQMTHVFECKLARGEKLTFRSLFGNKTLTLACAISLIVTAAVIYLPALQGIFSTASVSGAPLAISLACALISPLAGLLIKGSEK